MGLLVIGTTLLVFGFSIFVVNNAKFTFEKKKQILLAIIAFFSLLLLYQKITEPSADRSVVGMEDSLYKLPSLNNIESEFKKEYKNIEEINDYMDLLESNMDFRFDNKNKMGPVFTLISGEQQSGKTFAVQKLGLKIINDLGSQLLYIDLDSKEDKENNQKLIDNLSYMSFKGFLQKYQDAEFPPTLIIDHFEKVSNKETSYSSNMGNCYLCATLKQLYSDFNVNIILISNSPLSAKLLSISGVSKYVLDKQFQRNINQEQNLVKNLIKPLTSPELQQKIKPEYVEFCHKHMDFRFDFFNLFLNDWSSFENYKVFCEQQIEKEGKVFLQNSDLKSVGSLMVEYQQSNSQQDEKNKDRIVFNNLWVSYGYLKSQLKGDYQTIDQAISLGLETKLFEQQPGKIRFFSKLSHSAAITALLNRELSEIQGIQMKHEI